MAITFKEYQELSARTANKHIDEQVNYAMGLSGETGELVDIFKKHLFHSHPLPKDKIKKEAGDVLWYTSQLARIFDLCFDDAFERLNKMNETYGIIMAEGSPNRLLKISSLNLSYGSGNVSQFVDGIKYLGTCFYNVSSLEVNLRKVLKNLHCMIRLSGLTIEEVAEANIEKLKKRYPDGFDPEKSINRTE